MQINRENNKVTYSITPAIWNCYYIFGRHIPIGNGTECVGGDTNPTRREKENNGY